MRDHDLGGIYITDDYIDIGCGYDETPNTIREGNLNIRIDDNFSFKKRISFDDAISVEETFERIAEILKEMSPRLRALGAGCYGPFVSLDKLDEQNFGKIVTAISRRTMSGKNLKTLLDNSFKKVFGRIIPLYIDTDVECAALGEAYFRYTEAGSWNADGQGKNKSLLFLKVSKYGIGGAICQSANPYRGQFHSEMGQIAVSRWRDPWRDPNEDEFRFPGLEPYTYRLESLASGEAIAERFSPQSYEELREMPSHAAWHRQAFYIAQMCLNATAFFAPANIILGGRVMTVEGLMDKVRVQFRKMLGGRPYPNYPDALKDDFIDHASGLFSNMGQNDENGLDGKPGLRGALIRACLKSRKGNAVNMDGTSYE